MSFLETIEKWVLSKPGRAILLGLVLLRPAVSFAGFIVSGGTVTLSDNTVLSSETDIRLNSGALIVNNSEIIVGSTWSRTGGNFTQGTSTVTFTGSGADLTSSLLGSTTFYAFRMAAPGTTLRFTAGTTQYVTNNLILSDVTLRSTVENATWYLRLTGTNQSVTNVNVKDSNASGGNMINAINSFNAGNNTYWNFNFTDVGRRYWIATGAGNWNNSANWSLGSGGPGGAQVPLSTHTVIFDGTNNTNGTCNLDTGVTVATLTISGYTGTFNTQSYDVTVSSSFSQSSGDVVLGTSIFTLQGDLTRTGGTFAAGTSTITFTGSQNQNLTTASTGFYHLVIDKTVGSLTLNDSLELGGNMTLTQGTLNTNSQPITSRGNWTRLNGDYSGSGSTVTFNGSGTRALSGSTTFYGLRSIDPALTLQFAAGATTYVTNMVEFQNIQLRSTTDNATWYFTFTGSSQTLADVDVRDSNAYGGLMLRPDNQSIDSGNNHNWMFGDNRFWVSSGAGNWNTPANWSYVSGGAGGAPVPTSTHSVTFNGENGFNGAANMSGTVSVATLTLSGYTGTINTLGAAVTVSNRFLQSSGSVAIGTSIVTLQGDFIRTSGSFSTGVSTIQFTGGNPQTLISGATSFYHLVVNKSGDAVTLGDDLSLIGQMTVTAGTLDTNSSNHYASSSTLVNIQASGTFNANNSTLTLVGTSGTLFTRAGTFNQGNSRVTMIPNAAATLTSNNSITFHHLELSPTINANRIYTLGTNPLTINGDFTITPNAAATAGLQVNIGSTTIVAGTTLIQGSGLGTSNLTTTATNRNFTTANLNIVTGSTFTANASVVALNGSSGPLFTRTGTFTQGTSTVTMSPNANVVLTEGAITFNHLLLAPTLSTDLVYETGSGDLTVNGYFTIRPDKPSGPDATLTVNMGGAISGPAASVTIIDGTNSALAILDTGLGSNYSLSVGKLNIGTRGTLYGRDATITLSATTGPLFANTGSFVPGASTVIMNPNITVNPITSGLITFYNLSFTPPVSGNRVYTFGSSPVTINGDLNVNPGPTGAFSLTVNLGSSTVVVGTTTIQRSTANGSSALSTTASNFLFQTANLNVATAGTFTANGSTITINGTTSPLITRNGTFTQGTSTVTVTSAGNVLLSSGTITFAKLIIDSPNSTIAAGAVVTITDNLIINNGVLDDGGFQLTGNTPQRLVMEAGTGLVLGSALTATAFPTNFTAPNISLNANSTVTYNAGVNQNVSGVPAYGHLSLVAPSGTPTKTAQAAVVVSGDMTIGINNTYSVGTNFFLTIGGNYTNNGIFTAGLSTVTFNADSVGKTIAGNLSGTSRFNNIVFNNSNGGWSNTSAMVVAGTMTVTAGTLSGTNDITVNCDVVGNGTNGSINLTGGTFEQRLSAGKFFGTNAGGSNNWTFNNLTFSNSTGLNRVSTMSATGTGRIIVNGTLTVGSESDSNTTTLNDANNNRIINANGSLMITNRGVFQASSTNELTVGGDWTNNGTFTTNNSTVSFTGPAAQYVNNYGKAFANIISSNVSAGGVVFSSSFSAARLFINTSELNSPATFYFAARSTFTVSTFTITGTGLYPVVLRSTESGVYWHVNNTSTHTVSYAGVEDSDASLGLRILDYPGGQSINHNLNWVFGSIAPADFTFSNAQTTSLALSWSATNPPSDTYTVDVSTNQSFTPPATSSVTTLTNTTTSALSINTTYFARVKSTIQGIVSDWSSTISTSTLADIPLTAASTWTGVNFTSVTLTWLGNNNPPNVTLYQVQLSTVGNFLSGEIENSFSTTLQSTFTNLDDGAVYYAQVRAINHSGIATDWLPLGSTVTMTPDTPDNLHYTGASTSSLSAAWNIPNPAGDTYTFQVSTASNFTGTLVSSSTKNPFATTPDPLIPNTTYYGQVNSVNAGISSDWSAYVTTATLANPPSANVSTWTAVNFTSVTVRWGENNNPENVTKYVVELSTVANFLSGDKSTAETYLVEATYELLDPGTTYYAHVKAINHSGLSTGWVLLGSTITLSNTSCNAVASGNWDSGATWSNCTGPGGLPNTTDDIIINSGVNVTLNIDAAVQRVIFAAPGSGSNSLTQLSTVTLTANGNVIFNQPTTEPRSSSWNINGSTATVNGLISFLGSNTTTTRVSQITITSGQLDANNGMSFTASDPATKVIDMSGGAGKLNLKGSLTTPSNSSTLSAGTAGSLFNYVDDSAAQTVNFFSAGAYNNLYMNNTSVLGATLGGNVSATNVTGHLRVQSGTFKNGGFDIVGGVGDIFEVSNAATLEMSGTSSFPSGFSTITLGATSRVRYLQTTDPLTISAQTYGHLDLMPAGTATQNFPAGSIIIQGDLLIGNGGNITTVSANADNTTLSVTGAVTINSNAAFAAHASNPLTLSGDWTNDGTFTTNNSTVSFTGSAAQYINNYGKAFANIISSNVSAGGLVFSSSFSAARLFVNTPDLNAGTTLYFAAHSTFTVSTFTVVGNTSYPVVLRSTDSGSYWYLNNTSSYSVRYAQVDDSDASLGLRILDHPGGTDLGHNLNWVFTSNPPAGFDFSVINSTSLTMSWNPSSPIANSYDVEVSTNENFSAPVTMFSTALTNGTTSFITPNSTYYAQVRSVVEGLVSAWSSSISTVTLANIPSAAASTWTAVNLTSVTVNWSNNLNPLNLTQYVVERSTTQGFDGDDDLAVVTYSTQTTFENLDTGTTYYMQVKAVNNYGFSTDWYQLGSTKTVNPTNCSASAAGSRNWDVSGTWSNCTGPGGIPAPTDIITINPGVLLTLNVDATVGGIIFGPQGNANSLTQLSTVTLTVNGNVTMTQPTNTPRTLSWNINASTATVSGLISFPGASGAGTRIAQIIITSGQLNAYGGMTFTASINSSKVINMSGGDGELNLKGALTAPLNSATLTAGSAGSVFNYADDSLAQTVRMFPAGAYNHLYLNNTSALGAILISTITSVNVTGDVRVQSGVFKSTVPITGGAGDTFEVSNSAVYEMSGSTIFPTGFTTYNLGATSRVRYLQSITPLNITAQTYGHLDIIPPVTATRNLSTGTFTVAGDLTLGDGTNTVTVSANANNTTLTIDGDVLINSNSTLVAHATNTLTINGDWSNNGTFTHNNSTVAFAGGTAQSINNFGKAFSNVVSSNTSSGGVVFSSSFSATQLSVNTAALSSPATLYFSAGSTYTISQLNLTGDESNPVVLRSNDAGSYWYLNNTSTHSVHHVFVQDSNASAGLRILNYPGGVDLGHNLNWAIGLNAPGGFQLTDAQSTSLSYSWSAPTPSGDSYTLQISTNQSFVPPVTSSSTTLLNGTTSSLLVNTTYHAQLNTVINGRASSWTSILTTATLANIPLTDVSTWTVHYTSLTITWADGGNPVGPTTFEVRITTDSGLSGPFTTHITTNVSDNFINLVPAATYYSMVRAVNHSGLPTDWLILGSTATSTINKPTGLFFSSSTLNRLTAAWNASLPPGDSYTLQISTAQNFSGTITSSNTVLLIATTTPSLSVNTTYYGQVNAIVSGSSSPWTSFITTATLADIPAQAALTWTEVNITSLTVTWLENSNPPNVTQYHVQLSTVSNFLSGDISNSYTTELEAIFDQLDTGTTYYAQVRAMNHSGIGSGWLPLGSTETIISAIPDNVRFTSAQTDSLSAAWDASTPPGDSYTFQVSTDSNFGGTIVSSTTGNLFATTPDPLEPNVTYYGEARATVGGVPYPWSAYVTTATLANIPASQASTWTAVNITSITIAWNGNENPPSVTNYEIRITTDPGLGGPFTTHSTFTLTDNFTDLLPLTTYYAQVRAINHSGIPTNWHNLGSTITLIPNAPDNFQFTAASTQTLSAVWDAPAPAGDSYTFQVSTDSNFNGTLVSSTTRNLSATTPSSLIPNTTYYGQANALVLGATSTWTTYQTTVTLANKPATAVSTWTAVNLTSITVTWLGNNNPPDVTHYVVELSTAQSFDGETDLQLSTYSVQTTFESLETATTYFAQVRAVNHSGLFTDWLPLGGTKTLAPATCNAQITGNWNDGGTWINCTGTGGLPSITDIITINSGVVVTLNVDATVGGVIFATATTNNNALTHSGTNTLTVNGAVIFNQPTTSSRNNSWNINSATATVAGLISFRGSDTTSSKVSRIVITSGQLNALGGISFTASASATKLINMSGGAGRINIGGTLTAPNNSCTLLTGTGNSIISYEDTSAAQTVQFFNTSAYENLYLNNTSASGVVLGATITATNVAGHVRVQSGTFKNGTFAITGNTGKTFEVSDGATFEMSGSTTFPTGFATYSLGATSRVRYLQTTNPLTLAAQTYGHLDLMPAGTATQNFPAGALNVQGDLSIGNGSNSATVSADANNTTLTVGGSLTINTNASFTPNTANGLSVGDDWTNNGTFTANTGTVTFNGSGSTVQRLTGSTTFYGLRAVTAGTTIQFTAGTTFYVTNMLEFQNNLLKSSSDGSSWHFKVSASSITLFGIDGRDSNASLGSFLQATGGSTNSGNNLNWDFGPPSALNTFAANVSQTGGAIDLAWTAPGNDGNVGTLNFSTFTVQYTTDTAFAQGSSWSPIGGQPSYVYRLVIATTNVTPGTAQGVQITGLIDNATYYFREWTTDIVGNVSDISNGATNYIRGTVLSVGVSPSSFAFGQLPVHSTGVATSSITITNSGNTIQKYSLHLANPSGWIAVITPPGTDEYRFSAVFSTSTPSVSSFNSSDFVTTGAQTATSTNFAIDTETSNVTKGFSVPANSERSLWFRFEAPSENNVGTEQSITVTITAIAD